MTMLSPADVSAARAIIKQPPVRSIIADVSRITGIAPSAITGPCRSTRFVQARDLVCFVAREHGLSFEQIGRAINRDHSTVIAAVRREAARRGDTA